MAAVHEERKCKYCGKVFITSTAKQVFCSRKCQKKEKNYKYKSGNPDLMRRGNAYATDKAYMDRVGAFTSKFEYIGNTGKEDDAYYYLQCKDCGAIQLRSKQSFRPSKVGKTELVCTNCNKILKRKARRKAMKAKALQLTIKRQRKEREKKEREPRIVTSICARCGKEFTYTVVGSGAKRKYCSELCAKRQYNSDHEHTRRVRQGNGKKDNISLPLLTKRDKCKCWICGKKIDYKDYEVRENGAFIAGPSYPSIDHVVPLSKGGTHTWDNVRLAHRHCNMKKSNEMYFEGRNGQIMFSV